MSGETTENDGGRRAFLDEDAVFNFIQISVDVA